MLRVLTTTTALLIAVPALAQTPMAPPPSWDETDMTAESENLDAGQLGGSVDDQMAPDWPEQPAMGEDPFSTSPMPTEEGQMSPMTGDPLAQPSADPIGEAITAPGSVSPMGAQPDFGPTPANDRELTTPNDPVMDQPVINTQPSVDAPVMSNPVTAPPIEELPTTDMGTTPTAPVEQNTTIINTPTTAPVQADVLQSPSAVSPSLIQAPPVETPMTQDGASALADALAREQGIDPVQPAPQQIPMGPDTGMTSDPAAPISGTSPANAEALQEGAGGQVQETVINEDLARSSSEDFTTQATNERRGLSNDARNVLFGLGGFALGHTLADRSRVEMNTGDRIIVVTPQGEQRVVKNDDAMLVTSGDQIRTERFDDGSSRSVITRTDGSQIITIRSADLQVLNRRIVYADGRSVVLLDEAAAVEPVDVRRLPTPIVAQPLYAQSEDELRTALLAATHVNRAFSLQQILTIPEVRNLAAPIGVRDINFATGSAAISPEQARSLLVLGNVMRDMIARNPAEVFLIEGHTDTVGNDLSNLALSDRRAESLAKALAEYFDVPVQNLVVQGYGERYLLVPREGDVPENRRAAVRRITPLLQGR